MARIGNTCGNGQVWDANQSSCVDFNQSVQSVIAAGGSVPVPVEYTGDLTDWTQNTGLPLDTSDGSSSIGVTGAVSKSAGSYSGVITGAAVLVIGLLLFKRGRG